MDANSATPSDTPAKVAQSAAACVQLPTSSAMGISSRLWAPVTMPVLFAGLLVCVLLEWLGWFGYGARLPDTVRNPVSLLGMAIATAMAAVFLVLVVLHLGGFLKNPYVGLLVFIALPLLFLTGLVLIPAGAWWTARRRARPRGTEFTSPFAFKRMERTGRREAPTR